MRLIVPYEQYVKQAAVQDEDAKMSLAGKVKSFTNGTPSGSAKGSRNQSGLNLGGSRNQSGLNLSSRNESGLNLSGLDLASLDIGYEDDHHDDHHHMDRMDSVKEWVHELHNFF